MSYLNEIDKIDEKYLEDEMIYDEKLYEFCQVYKEEIERLESLNDLLKSQIQTLEHNIDMIDSNYQKLIFELNEDDLSRLNLIQLPESLKPQIECPEFKIIEADEGQELGHKEINLEEIFNKSDIDEINQNLNNPKL